MRILSTIIKRNLTTKNVFIGNIPFGAKEEDLIEYFGTGYGIKKVVIMTNNKGMKHSYGAMTMDGDCILRLFGDFKKKRFWGKFLRIDYSYDDKPLE